MHLSAIGRLALLKEFYGKIIIPPTVWKEVVEEGMGRIEGTDVKQPDRIGG
jgi:predicted nucleic acid-binding protein